MIPMAAKRTLRAQLLDLVRTHEVDTVVVGFPVREDGYEGEGCARSRVLMDILERAGIAAVLWDEAYTTAQADEVLRQGGIGYRKAVGKRDAIAASFILSSYLEGAQGHG